jgi:hypothetical protein
MRLMKSKTGLAVCAALLLAVPALADDAGSQGGDIVTRRLTQEQYRHIIADVFGPTIKVGGRFEPDMRRDGLIGVGAGTVSVTASGLEAYDQIARNIASQVVSEQHRATLIPCKPKSATEPDDACAKQFLSEVGRLLYRRPLKAEELQERVGVASAAATKLKDFYAGLGTSLATLLVSPHFLFREEVAEPDPDHPGQYRLDGYSKASQLSFFLWDAAPDPELLDAAQKGDLNSQSGLEHQVDRMIASPRLKDGVRAFFEDMLGFDEFQTLAKDALLFPKYSSKVTIDAQEQTLRTIADLLVDRKGDYRDLFTTRKTFLTPLLASIYGVPLVSPDGSWTPYEYPEGDPRAGILSEISFVALHAHPGRSSPTLRGKAIRTVILCQKVPDPPGNVNFTLAENTKNPLYKTARERMTAHRTEATCAGCHKLIDPIGFGLENFDSIGGYRTTENGATIDPTGELDGIKFENAAGLGKAVHDDKAAPACAVNRTWSYAVGRPPAKGETEFVKQLGKDFESDGYKFPDLMRRIATSDALYRVSPAQTGSLAVPGKLASDGNSGGERRQ